ncbi:hypothetical protein AAG906_010306 [Vitis piasezkii]
MEMHIAKQEKLSYIRGETNPPKESEDGYEKWYAENQKVKRWLLMSMSQEIWNALSKAFDDGSDELQVFTLNKKSFTAKQIYQKSIERQRVHIFLARLNGDFEQVRGEILRKDPLPDLEECYALIRREAVHHASMKQNLTALTPQLW